MISKMRRCSSSTSTDNRIREPLTEAEIRARSVITPEDVLRLNKITDDYLCEPDANVYDIEFTRFKIRDLDTDQILFEIAKPTTEELDVDDLNLEKCDDAGAARFVRYQFTPAFLLLKHVGATVEFNVGNKPVNKFRMIERHFFRDRLLKSFDFEFGFCIPNSRNTCEHIYDFPQLSESLIEEMISNPYETRSDSFYFVEDRLIMHNKADYAYNGGD
uniref:GMP_PDE_delta domain-containing protein n=1 Tax=Elaeophora elaphi TaxID=1147741 RepID=A0A0R3RG14_9BILA